MTPLPTLNESRPDLGPFAVLVDFGASIGHAEQGVALLALEKLLRELGIPAEVYKRTAPDDSRLRSSMTTEQRAML